MEQAVTRQAERQERALAGNTATGWLKLIALLFMFTDHAGKILFQNMTGMRWLGRVAFPLYAWCLVVGFHYTRSVPKYLLRLLIVGLISQPLYVVVLNHTWQEPNIFLTLVVALAALWGIREKWHFSQLWAPALALLLSVELHCDYGWRGVTLVMLLYAAQTSRAGIAAVMVAFCLYWGANSTQLNNLFGLNLQGLYNLRYSALLTPWLRLQAAAIFSLPLMLVRFPKDVKLPRWTGYALYPAHLLLLWALKALL